MRMLGPRRHSGMARTLKICQETDTNKEISPNKVIILNGL
jgi:hypothetical protein